MDVDQRGTLARQLLTLFDSGTLNGLTDGQLLELFAARAGESAELAFAALVERHGPMVHRVCRRLLGGPHDADDAFQATFLILARRAGAIRRRESVGPWLFGVALRVASCDRALRERRRVRERRAGERILRGGIGRPCEVEDSSDLARVVLEEVGRLPERYRVAVVLCDLEGLGHEEAARFVGCPVGTIKSRQARGRERLRGRLSHRGLAPSTMLPAALLLPEPGRASLTVSLFAATARIASAKGSAQALAAGAVPVAVEDLVQGALRTMFLTKLKASGLIAILAAGVIATGAAVHAFQGIGPGRAQEPAKAERLAGTVSDAGLLIVTGTVLMPDGSPASGATLASSLEPNAMAVAARTDEAGRFQLRGVFGNGGHIHASSADGSQQAILRVSSDAARAAFGSPLVLRLSAATTHPVTVLAEGRPVEGARVVASGGDFQVDGVTGRDGKVSLRLPAKGRLTEMVAWHPELGVGGVREVEKGLEGGSTRLTLLPRKSHEVRVVDRDGKPVGGLDLAINVRTEDSDWIVARPIEATHVRTDAEGMAHVPWVPRDRLKFVEVDCLGGDWKKDKTDLKQVAAGITTVHVRREVDVPGRLVMPEGANPEGILITGFGFGPGNTGDIPHARARRDGTFTLRVPAEHAYVLGISDDQWAADTWSGVILGRESGKPAEIAMVVYPATIVQTRVNRGPRRDPVVDAFVEASTLGKVEWVDAQGQQRSGTGGVSVWLRTDAHGVARAGVGRGGHRFRVASGLWDEEQEVRVASAKPVEVEFHRPWVADRRVAGRLMLGGKSYQPSPTLVARAWTPHEQRLPLEFKPVVRPDGTFEVAFDAPVLSLFFVDRDKRLGGFARLGLEDASVDVSLEPTATYGGTLLDEADRPMADRTLQIYVKTSRFEAVAAQQTDRAGRFRFEGVPSNVPLELNISNEAGEPEYFLFDRDRMLLPGEVREDDRVKPQRAESPSPVARAAVPWLEGVEVLRRNVRSSGLLGLVVLQGDPSEGVVKVVDHLLDDRRVQDVASYLPLRVKSDQWKPDAALLAEQSWPAPGPGEVVLVVLGGDGKTLATRRVAATDREVTADGLGKAFLKQHRPPARDARDLLARARQTAKETGRRVWVVHGGPRCAPCFRLAGWMEDQHSSLEKDFVIVKVMDGVDERVAEVLAELPEKSGEGIPWFAITEPDGTILATSSGPLGNIGFPGSVEGLRHLRQMLDRTARKLKPDELDGLIHSLSPGR